MKIARNTYIHIAFFIGAVFYLWGGTNVYAAQTGLVDGVWLAHDTELSSRSTVIYTALYNETGDDVSGTVTFTDAGHVLGAVPATLAPHTVVRAELSYTFPSGTHILSASFAPTNGAESALGTRTVFVDEDTDGDLIGNSTDPDDDNDGLPDADELLAGTNPLVADTDGDGVDDFRERVAGTNPLDVTDTPTRLALIPQEVGSALNQARTVADTLGTLGGAVSTYMTPRAANLAKAIEQNRDAHVAAASPFLTTSAATPEADTSLPRASTVRNLFLAAAAVADLDWLSWGQRIAYISMTIGSYLLYNWILIPVLLLVMIIARTMYRWQRMEY